MNLFLLSLVFLVFSPTISADEQAGEVVSVSNRVLVRNASQPEGGVRVLKVGNSVFRGDVINTSSNSSLKLLMKDQSIVDLGASTLFKVDEFKLNQVSDRDVKLSMMYGKVRASINKKVGKNGKFKIRTRSATMGVRGTELVILSDLSDSGTEAKSSNPATAASATQEAKTQIIVLEGKVEVDVPSKSTRSKPPITLTEGSKLTTLASVQAESRSLASEKPAEVKQLKVEQMSKSEMTSITAQVQELKADRTFENVVVVDDSSVNGDSTQGAETLSSLGEDLFVSDEAVNPADWSFDGMFNEQIFENNLGPGLHGQPVKLRVVFHR